MSARGAALCALLAVAAWQAAFGPLGAPGPGAALREALARSAAGDAAGAAERFAAVAASAPEVADHASELRIEALLGAGDPGAALAAAAEFRAKYTDPWLLSRVAAHEGAAQAALQREPEARDAFERALASLPEGASESARLLAEIARSFERSGAADAAAARWQTVWTRHATSAEAARAGEALARLAAANPALVYRTPEALKERCLRLSDALRNEEASVACDAALAVSPADRDLLEERAELRFRMRRYTEAAEAFAALGSEAPAMFWRARSLARAGRTEEALAAFARVAASRDRELAARARFLAGTLHEDDDLAAAEASYRAVAEAAPLAAQRSAARWRLAWLAWRRGDHAAAASALERFVADEPDPAEQVRGRYWLGRTLARLGRPEGRERLAEIAGEAPLSYYGWRAAAHLDGAAPVAADAALAASAGAPPGSDAPELPAALLRRLQFLLEAGLDERAAREIRPLVGAAANRKTRLELAQLLLEAGQYHRAQRLVIDAHAGELAREPLPGDQALWWLAWPTAWDQVVERAADAHDVEPALVYAIMREESGYQPDALSVAGARGLAQIMPDTGRRLALDLGARSFDPAELFVPERNLELSAFYLAQLLERFGGRTSAAIASYNAGPEVVTRWIAATPAAEDDEWVETIPYDQTRSYVKRVLRSLHVYRTLYGS